MPLLEISIILWSLALLASAFAGSFSSLLLSRLALGAVAATAGPAIASLSGDYFGADERGRIWSYILVGESAGTAFGYIVCGFAASLIHWRASFIILAIPGFLLARELRRTVPEPLRGGQSHLKVGTVEIDVEALETETHPDRKGLAEEEAGRMGLVRAVRYLFSIPSNALLIIGSSLGYFYFAGLQTFALLYVKGHFHASQAAAELVLALLVGGAVVGTLAGGRLPDWLLKRGDFAARVRFPAICYLAASVLLIPGFVGSTLLPAVWFYVAGAALISAANPPLQAARLDVVPAGLWGRAQSALTVVRSLAQAASPLLFGGVSDLVAGIVPKQAPITTTGTHAHAPSSNTATGLEVTFLIMLTALFGAGLVLLRARKTFATDVATAAASEPSASRAQPASEPTARAGPV
jgi:MFS family permease